ncbi:MAG: hypothetical protein ACYDAO_00620 [Thermoplasmataceae archaeon]
MDIKTARVDRETKEKMKRLSYINWNDIIRESIAKKIREVEARERIVDRKAIAKGIEIASTVRKSSVGWNSTEEIRKWRDQKT